ncbi:MAG: FAD-dependent oxidoreductase [Akkermansiaceae bacterium]|nr:FAD-dependent oxidoreductase [Akkermansiaceae bacterium]
MIVGGGVIGLCVGYFLARAGRRVLILDRDAEDADNCSTGNAGMVVPSHFVPLAAPGVIGRGLKWLLDPESPFYVRPRMSGELLRWGWLFMRSATCRNVEESAGLLCDLQMRSRALFSEIAAEGDFGLVQRGLLMLCESERTLDEEARLVARAGELGIEAELCDPRRLGELDPDIEMRVAGGVWWGQDCHLDPRKFLGVLRAGIRKNGGEFRYDAEVTGVAGTRVALATGEVLEGSHVVLAGGAFTPMLARSLGTCLPMQAGKGYSMTLARPPQLPRLCSLLGEAKVAVTPMGTSLRVAGTMEICGHDRTIDERRVRGIIKAACRVFPRFSEADFEGVPRWAGLRPCSPDGLPYVGPVPGHERLFVASGHAMLGLSLGPVTGELVAALVDGRTPPLPVGRLAVGRF